MGIFCIQEFIVPDNQCLVQLSECILFQRGDQDIDVFRPAGSPEQDGDIPADNDIRGFLFQYPYEIEHEPVEGCKDFFLKYDLPV